MASDNLQAARSLRRMANVLRQVPYKMGEFFANGGAGNSNPVVGDRYQGIGNARFKPLSTEYAEWKAGKAKDMNAHAKATYGRGSKLITVEHKRRTHGVDVHGHSKNLPILVLSGKLRNAVTMNRSHLITVSGDIATVTFIGLPGYAVYLHKGTSHMPKRSPVEPNEADIKRVVEATSRWVSAQIGAGTAATSFGQGQARTV